MDQGGKWWAHPECCYFVILLYKKKKSFIENYDDALSPQVSLA